MNAIMARAKRDDGFTLVELLIGIVILGVVLGAIANALIVGLTTTNDTSQRFSESHDAQIASAYLAKDVQSALSITNATTPSCGAGALIGFTLDGGKQVSYYYGPASGGETQVTRRSCDGSGAQVLAHFAGGGTPGVTCDGNPCNPAVQPKPNVVKISITEASGYSFTLLGARRAWNSGGGSGGTSTPPLTLLAFGNSPLQIKGGCKKKEIDPTDPEFIPECEGAVWDPQTQNDTAKLTVNGNLYVNAAVNGAVRFTGKGRLAVPAGEFKILQGGTCQRCSPGNTYPYPPGSYTPAYPDPLRFMSNPTSTTPRTCSGGVCQPGVYNSKLTLSSNATLSPGIYILKDGMQVNGSATVTGTGVMIFNESGSITFNGGSTINLTPYAADPYKGILIFQGRTNTSDLRLSGGTALNPASIVGIVYAPNASNVYLGSGGATMHVTAVVAKNIVVTGNSGVTIG